MKPSLINTTTFERISGFGDSATLNDNTFAAVTFNSAAACRAQLMVQTQLPDGQQTTTFHDIPFVGEHSFQLGALIAWDGKPCLLMNTKTAYWFDGSAQSPRKIDIQGADEHLDDLRLIRHHDFSGKHSDCDLIAISLKAPSKSAGSLPRHFGILKMDTATQSLRWVYSGEIPASSNPSISNAVLNTIGWGCDTMKIDSLQIRNNSLYAFCPGVSDSRVERWGMDFYCVKKASCVQDAEKITLSDFETIYESENFDLISPKKSGAYGFFSSTGDTLLLTPVFGNDSWKGKPKAYNFASESLQDIALPRGVSKGQLLQKTATHVWYQKVEQLSYDEATYTGAYQTHLVCMKCE